MRLRRGAAGALLGLALLGCGAAPDAPDAVVALYFHSLGRDPIRSAALMTPAFHAHHGLRVKSAWTDALGEQQPFRLSSAELAWLGVQRRREYVAYAAQLTASITEVRRDDARHAVVAACVGGPGAPPFTQRFFLVRAGPDAAWRIDRIEQEDLAPADKIAAFVASPSRDEGRPQPPAGP
jgi:hypothetical protein